MSPKAHNPAARWTWCDRCRHRGYHSRSDAKTVRKRHPGEKGMSVYPCPHAKGLFHLGHRPDAARVPDIVENDRFARPVKRGEEASLVVPCCHARKLGRARGAVHLGGP